MYMREGICDCLKVIILCSFSGLLVQALILVVQDGCKPAQVYFLENIIYLWEEILHLSLKIIIHCNFSELLIQGCKV